MVISALDDGYGDAAVSQWTTRVVAFTRWVGPGRRVTQTGRLTLAQARELVPALDTADVIDPVVHGQVHRTTSSEELPDLNTTCAWAKAARLVRATSGKLVVVRKNAVLLERPVPLWERMFTTFGALGPAICPTGWGESLLRGHFAEGIRAVLSGVSGHDGPAGLDLVCQRVGTRSAAVAGSPASRPPTGTRGGGAAIGMFVPPSVCWSASARCASTAHRLRAWWRSPRWGVPRCPHAGEAGPGRGTPLVRATSGVPLPRSEVSRSRGAVPSHALLPGRRRQRRRWRRWRATTACARA